MSFQSLMSQDPPVNKNGFPKPQPNQFYLCEGGPETEFMFKHGFDLPEFALFTALDNPKAMQCLFGMYHRYLEVVANHQCGALVSGLDYRASQGWADKLGYSAQALDQANLANIEFLTQLQHEYRRDIPQFIIQGLLGPKDDAYQGSIGLSAQDAKQYHSAQLLTHHQAGLTLVSGMSVHHVPEAVGMVCAARDLGQSIAISLSLNQQGRLSQGETLKQAILQIDSLTQSYAQFYMINCVHPIEYTSALEQQPWISRLRGVRPNAVAMDRDALSCSNQLHAGDPKELAQQLGQLADRNPHMDIWGGCCGTWDQHLELIAAQMVERNHC